jgi:Protein of unknown function (DUF3309)
MPMAARPANWRWWFVPAPTSAISIPTARRENMSITTILLIILVLILIGALPTWPYSSAWGYTPSGVLGAIVIVMLVLLLLGRI